MLSLCNVNYLVVIEIWQIIFRELSACMLHIAGMFQLVHKSTSLLVARYEESNIRLIATSKTFKSLQK
jgi:hypothetical protein